MESNILVWIGVLLRSIKGNPFPVTEKPRFQGVCALSPASRHQATGLALPVTNSREQRMRCDTVAEHVYLG